MKKLLLLSLLATAMNAMAAESLKTPYGTLAVKKSDSDDAFSRIVLDGKPIKGLTDGEIMKISDAPYKLGKQDIYIISSESSGNGSIATQEKYYDLLVFESDKKPKVVSNDELWVNRFQDHKDAVFSVKDNKLYGDLGPREGYNYSMIYDGKNLKVKKGKKIKVSNGNLLVDKETCQSFYEEREDFCEYIRDPVNGSFSSATQRSVEFLLGKPGINNKSIENFCKNKKSVDKAQYKTFESKVCKS